MGRHRKQVDPSMLVKLPPCLVCDAPAAGFHYGVNTCDACKGFFHRSLRTHGQYKCLKEGHCVIEHGKKKFCQLCRYHKCLSVGMAKEAIKTGRYTSAKKTSDTLIIIKKKLNSKTGVIKGHKENSTKLICDSISGAHFLSSCPVTQDSLSSEHLPELRGIGLTESAISSNRFFHGLLDDISQRSQRPEQDCVHSPVDCSEAENSSTTDMFMADLDSPTFTFLIPAKNTEVTQELQDPSSLFKSTEARQLSLNSLCETLAPMKPTKTLQQADTTTADFFGSPSSCSYSGSPPAFSSASAFKQIGVELPEQNGPVPFSPFMSSFPASLLLSPSETMLSAATSNLSPNSSVPATINSIISSTNSESSANINDKTTPATSDFGLHITDSNLLGSSCNQCHFDGDSKSIRELYMDKDAVIKMLTEAHETYLMPVFGHLSEEEKEKQHKEHLEECKLHREMFGPLYKLPDHEYDFIFATTGLDADDRQKHLRIVSATMEKTIQGILKFAQHIPGFLKVDIGDKVNLIKYSGHEVCGLTLLKYINFEMRIVKGLDMTWKCEHDFAKYFPPICMDMFKKHINFLHSFNKLKLTDEELTIVKAISIMSSDRDPPVDSPAAREIHFQLTECLIHLLSKRVLQPLQKFAKIIDRLTESRTQLMYLSQFYEGMGIEKYSSLEGKPLTKEMMTGIFSHVKEETH